MKYYISKKRLDYISKHFFEWSFHKEDDFLPDKKFFEKLNHPTDLHYLADIYNWDDEPIVLGWVLDSPLCTRATANLIFWRAAPDYYLGYNLDEVDNVSQSDQDVLALLQKIIKKYTNNDFSKYQIAFDPTTELESTMTKQPKWSYPSGVYDTIKGVELYVKPWWKLW